MPRRITVTVAGVVVAVAAAAGAVVLRDAATSAGRVEEVAAVADRLDLPYRWRDVVVDVSVGCRPAGGEACPLGSWDPVGRTLVVAEAAFTDERLLVVVVAHELAHVQLTAVTPDVAGPVIDAVAVAAAGPGTAAAGVAELAADCLAVAYGAPTGGWWRCPPDIVAAVAAAAGVR